VQFGAPLPPRLLLQGEDVERQLRERSPPEVDGDRLVRAGRGPLEAQALGRGEARLDALEEHVTGDAVLDGQSLGDGEGQLEDGRLVVVGLTELLQQRGGVDALAPAVEQEGVQLA
jgi:hypothetical protein